MGSGRQLNRAAGASRIRRGAAVGVVVALVAGCGSSSSSTSSSTGSSATASTSAGAPTKAEFIARADSICRQSKTKYDPQVKAAKAALSAEQKQDSAANRHALGAALNQEAQIAATVLNQLRALQPPPGDGATIGSYFDSVGTNINLAHQFVNAIDNNNVQALQTISQQLNRVTATAERQAKSYGFKVCGSGTA